MAHASQTRFDYALVGGGLGSALLALALLERRPAPRVALVEQEQSIGGNHLWCFHAGDVPEACRFVRPLLVRRWPRYEVRFPGLSRTLDEPYAAVSSERLDQVVRQVFAAQAMHGSLLLLSSRAVSSRATSVMLESGQTLTADVVIESRGPAALPPAAAGYQKFVGLELELRRPAPLEHPLLMDALVPQRDGFRFMYALPLEPQRLLLEDTYFSDDPRLDPRELEGQILAYAERLGVQVERVVRRESGVLPLPLSLPRVGDIEADGPLIAGYQGGWFHPVTGYSFPLAVRVANAVAQAPSRTLRAEVWPALAREQREQLRFGVLLNRLMFGAFVPERRYAAIERFYRLPAASVRRFYAMNLTRGDQLRILCGRPPHGFSLSRVLGHRASRAARAA